MTSYLPFTKLIKDDYIQTNSGNIISRKCTMLKSQNVEFPSGKCVILDNVILKGDFAPIKVDKYCIIQENTTIQPCHLILDMKINNNSIKNDSQSNNIKYIPLTIGAYTYIGKNCMINSASIGLGCIIGDNCILNSRSILKDHVHVEDNTIIPNDMVIPPFAIVSGTPGKIIGFVCESASITARNISLLKYKSFIMV